MELGLYWVGLVLNWAGVKLNWCLIELVLTWGGDVRCWY